MQEIAHYLKRELYDQIKEDPKIFEFLQQGSLDGIWYWNLETQTDEWMSPRFWEVLGYNPEEKAHLASEWKGLIHPGDLEVAQTNLIKHCADPDHPYDQVVRYRHKDGSTVWVRCRGIAIRNEAGKPIRLLGAHTDLTQLKRTEEQLRTKTMELCWQIEEREQLSQDLHDNTLQSLYAVGMQLEASKLVMRKSPQKMETHLTQAIEDLNHQMRSIRQFITMLKQPTTPKPNFGKALRQLVESFSADGPAAPKLEIDDTVLSSTTPRQEEHLLNIAREAISNSMRHAHATHRAVQLSHTGKRIRLVISDDGIGFSAGHRHPRRHGLANMSARANKIHARLILDSAPGKGTCVTIAVPKEKGDGHT